ncbi:MAG: hypothetical protein LBF97_05740 [Elusimicrobiota bacterium]|nr:hypothetical protein [Elusimicrobiota bacterium]
MIKDFIKHLKKNNYSKNTINTYRSILKIHLNDLSDIRNLKISIRRYFHSPNTA